MKYICPICDYPNLSEEPFYSYEVCPQCYFESGVDDAMGGNKDSEERIKWLAVLRDRWQKEKRLWPGMKY